MAKKRAFKSNTPHECFWQAQGEDCCKLLVSWCNAVMSANSGFAARAYRYSCAYDGVTLTSMNGFTFDAFSEEDKVDAFLVPVTRNTLRRLVRTFIAKSFANDNCCPQMVSTDGNFEQRLAAENIDDALMAEFSLQHGQFSTIHEMHRHGGSIAACATGQYWIFAFPGEGKVEAELDDGLTIGTVRTGLYGRVITLCRTIWRDPEWLIHRYPKKKQAILDAVETVQANQRYGDMRMGPSAVQRNGTRIDPRRLVRVHQGWRVKLGDEDGREIFCLKSGVALEDNVWEHDSPPGKDWRFEDELNCDRGVSMTQTIYRMFMREQEAILDADRFERNSPMQLILCSSGSAEAPNIKAQLQGAVGIQLAEVPGNPANAVKIIDNTGLPRTKMQLIDLFNTGQHQVTGISSNQTDGMRQVGTTSGIHESLTASYYTENFADQERRAIQFRAVECARLFVWALQKVVQGKYSRWVGDGSKRRQLTEKDLDLDENKYVLQIKPASEEKDSPKARLEKAERLLQDPAGRFSGADLVQVWKNFDEKEAENKAYAVDEWVEEQCTRWLKSTPQQTGQEGWYQSPMKWMLIPGLESALQICSFNYLRARQDGAPTWRLKFFEQFMDECVELIDQLKQREAQLQAASIGKGSPGPAPGAPTGGPESGGNPSPAGPGPGPGQPTG